MKATTEQLSNETASFEEQEAGLVHDCVHELQEMSRRIGQLHDELAAKSDVIASQNEKVSELMAKIAALEKNSVKVLELYSGVCQCRNSLAHPKVYQFWFGFPDENHSYGLVWFCLTLFSVM